MNLKPTSASLLLLILLGLASDPVAATLWQRIQQLEALGVEGAWNEVVKGLDAIEPELDGASLEQRARISLIEARMLAVTNQPAASIKRILDVLQEREQLGSALELRALTLATNVLVFNERFEEGFDYFREALQLAPMVSDPESRAVAWIVAADFHGKIGEPATAIEYANRVLIELEGLNALRPRCAALFLRAQAHRVAGSIENARDDFEAAAERCSQIPDRIYAGSSRIGLAQSLSILDGAPERIEQQLHRAIEDHRQADFVDGLLEAHVELARGALNRGEVERAASYLAPTTDWIDRVGSHSLRADALFLTSDVASLRGSSENAYALLRQALQERDRHAANLRQMRLRLLLSGLDERARAAELDLLRARNDAIRLARGNDRQDEVATWWAGSGALAAALLLFIMVFQTGRDRQRYRELARLDGLTGLVNHTRFFELAAQGFQRARQNRGRFVLIIADIDLFKRINDEYGHLVGDAVLRRVGARFIEAFGKEAVVGRLGGEEIGVALTDCDLDTALARIEHLRAILNRRRSDDAEPEITISFGVAELRREKSLDSLYAHADHALYDAKDAGRNRVVTVSPIDLSGPVFVT